MQKPTTSSSSSRTSRGPTSETEAATTASCHRLRSDAHPHTGDPGEAGNQETSEATFGSYARQAVARSAAGWNVAAGVGDNNGPITFPEASSGSESITYVGIGTDSTGTGNLIWSGILDAARAVSAGITLQFADTALDITAD